MTNEEQIPTIKGGVSEDVYTDGSVDIGLGGFFKALGKGIKKVAQVGWDAVKIIGEHADELFPDHYSAYERYQPLDNADDLFGDDDYLQNHVFKLPKNRMIMDKLANADLLDDNDIKQTDWITQLLEDRADTEPKKFASQSFRTNALKAIVGNQLMHSPIENGKVQYRGNWVEEYQAPYLVKSDVNSLLQKDRRMTLPEIKEWPQIPLPRPRHLNPTVNRGAERIEPTMQSAMVVNPIPINPLPPGTGRLLEGEHPYGPRSNEKKYPPIKLPKMDAKTAYTTFYTGQGQSYQVPFSSIQFRNGTFRQDSQFMKEVNKLRHEAQKQETIVTKDIHLSKQGYEFKDKSTDEAWVYGNVRIDVKGELLVDAKGNWEFGGTFLPNLGPDDKGDIYRGDRFNFDPAKHRTPEAELAIQLFHSTPGTSFKIYFTDEPVKVRLSNRKKR